MSYLILNLKLRLDWNLIEKKIRLDEKTCNIKFNGPRFDWLKFNPLSDGLKDWSQKENTEQLKVIPSVATDP